MLAVASTILLAIAGSAAAQATSATAVTTGPTPLTPPTANVGAPCVISWAPDASGTWNATNIELMTGDNQNMVHITTVTTVDTTSAAPTSFTWTCPDVTPNAEIYFYQFSHAAQPNNLLWTTRFTIAAADGSTTQPQYATQPNGQAVPWGIGTLVDPSTAKPAPTYITGETSDPAGSGSVSLAPGATSAVAQPASTSSPTMQTVTVLSTTAPEPTSSSTVSGAAKGKLVGSAFALTGAAALIALLA